jgi:hypothetical protein
MQLKETQPEPLAALLQLNFCYQLQMGLVPPDAHLLCCSALPLLFIQPLYVCVGYFITLCLDYIASDGEMTDELKGFGSKQL